MHLLQYFIHLRDSIAEIHDLVQENGHPVGIYVPVMLVQIWLVTLNPWSHSNNTQSNGILYMYNVTIIIGNGVHAYVMPHPDHTSFYVSKWTFKLVCLPQVYLGYVCLRLLCK